jgi:hypothetical protein
MLCSTDREIADVPVHEVWTFRDGKLVSVFFIFNSGNYSTLREIFAEKYGPPSTVRHESLQTLMGVRDENETQTWKGEKVSVLLPRYFKKITEGVASIETNAYSGAVSKEADSKKRRALRISSSSGHHSRCSSPMARSSARTPRRSRDAARDAWDLHSFSPTDRRIVTAAL